MRRRKQIRRTLIGVIIAGLLGGIASEGGYFILRNSHSSNQEESKEEQETMEKSTEMQDMKESINCTVVIDPGHGGRDPGKVAGNILEKDLNLAISLFLKEELEKCGAKIVMTRDGDYGLYKEDVGSKKRQDLDERVEISKQGDLYVSIHMNSYTKPSVCGAQAFYNEQNSKGKELAQCIQEQLKEVSVLNSGRKASGKGSYYMLHKVEKPAAIIECGFLSCPEELEFLCQETYQRKMAGAICAGIVNYMKKAEAQN